MDGRVRVSVGGSGPPRHIVLFGVFTAVSVGPTPGAVRAPFFHPTPRNGGGGPARRGAPEGMTSASGKAVRTESPLLRRPILPYGKLGPNKETNSCAGHPCPFVTRGRRCSVLPPLPPCSPRPQPRAAPRCLRPTPGAAARRLRAPRSAPRRQGAQSARAPARRAPSRHSRHAAPCAQRLVAVRTAPWRSPA